MGLRSLQASIWSLQRGSFEENKSVANYKILFVSSVYSYPQYFPELILKRFLFVFRFIPSFATPSCCPHCSGLGTSKQTQV